MRLNRVRESWNESGGLARRRDFESTNFTNLPTTYGAVQVEVACVALRNRLHDTAGGPCIPALVPSGNRSPSPRDYRDEMRAGHGPREAWKIAESVTRLLRVNHCFWGDVGVKQLLAQCDTLASWEPLLEWFSDR